MYFWIMQCSLFTIHFAFLHSVRVSARNEGLPVFSPPAVAAASTLSDIKQLTLQTNRVVIIGPSQATEGMAVVLTCIFPANTSSNFTPFWEEETKNLSLRPPMYQISTDRSVGRVGISNLSISNVSIEHTGLYTCQVGSMESTLSLSVIRSRFCQH